MTYTLSFDSMLRRLYARSAMAATTAGNRDSRPTALQPDHAPALRLLLRDAFASLCSHLGTLVTATNLDDIDIAADPFLTLDLALPSGCEGAATLTILEQAVALGALARVWDRPDLAAEAAEAADAVGRLLPAEPAAPCRARLTPCYF